jgi:hypothetical protein
VVRYPRLTTGFLDERQRETSSLFHVAARSRIPTERWQTRSITTNLHRYGGQHSSGRQLLIAQVREANRIAVPIVLMTTAPHDATPLLAAGPSGSTIGARSA